MSRLVSKTLSHAMRIHEKKLAITANNLANASTAGYKAVQVVFDMPKTVEALNRPENPSMASINSYVDLSTAALVETGGRLDLAIRGNGFFVLSTSNGTRYTRDGRFTLDAKNRLVTPSGDPVMGESGEIVLHGKEVAVQSDGSIHVDGQPAGRLKVVDFEERESLQPVGANLFVNRHEDGREISGGGYSVEQGCYEASNVDVMRELTNLIDIQRSFEAYDKAKRMTGDASKRLMDLIAK